MKNDTRENTGLKKAENGMARQAADSSDALKRALGRFMALIITTVGALAAGMVLLTLTACDDDDDDDPRYDWYLSGTWQNNSAPYETLTFYGDGSGYWSSDVTGAYLDFDYYCNDDDIYFTMYPSGAPSYTLDCDIDLYGPRNMYIEWPSSSMWGPTTIYYTRID